MWIFLGIVLAIIVAYFAAKPQKFRAMIESIKLFYSEVSFEMTKVIWPTQNEVINSTIIVLVVATVLTIGIMVVDFILGNVITTIFAKS